MGQDRRQMPRPQSGDLDFAAPEQDAAACAGLTEASLDVLLEKQIPTLGRERFRAFLARLRLASTTAQDYCDTRAK